MVSHFGKAKKKKKNREEWKPRNVWKVGFCMEYQGFVWNSMIWYVLYGNYLCMDIMGLYGFGMDYYGY